MARGAFSSHLQRSAEAQEPPSCLLLTPHLLKGWIVSACPSPGTHKYPHQEGLLSLDIRSYPMNNITHPCSSIASACRAMHAVVMIAIVTVIPYLDCTHHSLQHALHPTPPLILSSQEMIPDPVSEKMKLGLREGKRFVQGGTASKGHHQDSNESSEPSHHHSNRGQEKRVPPTDPRFLHLSWSGGRGTAGLSGWAWAPIHLASP